MDEQSRIEKIKTHISENKTTYIAVGVTVVTTAAVTAALLNRDSVKVIAPRFFSPGNNLIITNLERRGHPGFKVLCKETGETFASVNRAASACGVNQGNLSRHLNGYLDHVKGLHFEKLGEMA